MVFLCSHIKTYMTCLYRSKRILMISIKKINSVYSIISLEKIRFSITLEFMKKSKKRAIIKNIGYIVGISIFLFVMNTYNRVQIHEDSLDLYLKPLKTAYIQRYYFLRTLSDQSQVFHLSSSFSF